MHQLWNGIARNYKDRFWRHLTEIFWAIPFQSWCIFLRHSVHHLQWQQRKETWHVNMLPSVVKCRSDIYSFTHSSLLCLTGWGSLRSPQWAVQACELTGTNRQIGLFFHLLQPSFLWTTQWTFPVNRRCTSEGINLVLCRSDQAVNFVGCAYWW